MICLPDVNLWIALLVPEHAHHDIALAWYEGPEWDRLALCRVTQMGLLRLLTNRHVMGARVATPVEARDIVNRLLSQQTVLMSAEPGGLDEAWQRLTGIEMGGRNFWTDAYLAAFAQLTGYPLVTFDRGFAKYPKVPVRLLGLRPH